jgi:hypothetical protein
MMRKHQKTKLRNDLQNNWPIVLKSVKVMKDKENLKISPKLELIKETQQLNAG